MAEVAEVTKVTLERKNVQFTDANTANEHWKGLSDYQAIEATIKLQDGLEGTIQVPADAPVTVMNGQTFNQTKGTNTKWKIASVEVMFNGHKARLGVSTPAEGFSLRGQSFNGKTRKLESGTVILERA